MVQQKPFILLVEDDQPLLKVLTRYLEAVGYVVLQASSFYEAADKIAIKPNLVILDIHLPDASGWDVLNWLESQTRPVPIIVMSGVARPSPKQLQRVGVKAFLSKPFAIDEMLKLVKQYAPVAQA
jgi:two-component system KDP operon response regulator KdpE